MTIYNIYKEIVIICRILYLEFLNLKRIFDKILHKRFIEKLIAPVLHRSLLRWIKNWLANHRKSSDKRRGIKLAKCNQGGSSGIHIKLNFIIYLIKRPRFKFIK